MKLLFTFIAVVVFAAQESTFVASVKANKSGAPGAGAAGDRFSNGQWRTTNMPLRLLMRQVFERFQELDLTGGPGWLDIDRWDINAKSDSPTADMRAMMRTVLADRFKLITHHETRTAPIYTIVLA